MLFYFSGLLPTTSFVGVAVVRQATLDAPVGAFAIAVRPRRAKIVVMSALCRHVCIARPGKHRPIFGSDLAAPAIATRRDRL